MVCPTCGKPVNAEQRFCNACGASLRGVTEATAVLDPVPTAPAPGASDAAGQDPTGPDGTDAWANDDPEWAATGRVPTVSTALSSAPNQASANVEMPTQPIEPPLPELDIDDVWAATAEQASTASDDAPPTGILVASEAGHEATSTIALERLPGGPVGGEPERARPRFGVLPLTACGSAILGLLGSFVSIAEVTSDTRLTPTDTFRTGSWQLDDLASNLPVAVLIAAVLMVAGGMAAAYRWRWGAGLAGGAGLSMLALAGIALGLAQFPLDAAREFANTPSATPFVLTLTRDVGFWLLAAAGVLAVVAFAASLSAASGDHRDGLNPWVAALGALATVVAVIGPMLPEGTATFSDNWYLIEAPGQPSGLLLAARLLQLGLLFITGVVGFLSVRRWGLGLTLGGSLPAVWLAASTLFEIGSSPIGLAYRNPGAPTGELHGVTIIGVSAVVAMSLLALVAAYDQDSRTGDAYR